MSDTNRTFAEVSALSEGERFNAFGLVTSVRMLRDRNDNPYWNVELSDKTGTITAKIWGNCQWYDKRSDPAKVITSPAESPDIINLKGKTLGVLGQVGSYNGKTQYTFNKAYILNQTDERYKATALIPSSDVPIEELSRQFSELINGCSGPAGDFLRFVFDPQGPYWDMFLVYPAAVAHHHAYVHGLLEHTLGVARLAKSMAESYAGSALRPDVNVVTAGACLHDLGKLDSYLLSPGPEMTLEGTVIDHVARGYAKFCRLAEEFGLQEPLKTHLGHILLSHHGQKEFGSPVLPATPEALIVAAADNLDFLLACWSQATGALDGGTDPGQAISAWDFSAQRRFWKWRPDDPAGSEPCHTNLK